MMQMKRETNKTGQEVPRKSTKSIWQPRLVMGIAMTILFVEAIAPHGKAVIEAAGRQVCRTWSAAERGVMRVRYRAQQCYEMVRLIQEENWRPGMKCRIEKWPSGSTRKDRLHDRRQCVAEFQMLVQVEMNAINGTGACDGFRIKEMAGEIRSDS